MPDTAKKISPAMYVAALGMIGTGAFGTHEILNGMSVEETIIRQDEKIKSQDKTIATIKKENADYKIELSEWKKTVLTKSGAAEKELRYKQRIDALESEKEVLFDAVGEIEKNKASKLDLNYREAILNERISRNKERQDKANSKLSKSNDRLRRVENKIF